MKKILSWSIVVVMVLTILPMGAMAAPEELGLPEKTISVTDEETDIGDIGEPEETQDVKDTGESEEAPDSLGDISENSPVDTSSNASEDEAQDEPIDEPSNSDTEEDSKDSAERILNNGCEDKSQDAIVDETQETEGSKEEPIKGTIESDTNISTLEGDVYTVTQDCTLSGTNNIYIKIEDGVAVTLSNVSIDQSSNEEIKTAIAVLDSATIILDGTNNIKSGFNKAGINVNKGKSLTIKGSGTLNATGGQYGAGIGGSYIPEISCAPSGTIIIAGGTVNATGGEGAAGIGSGKNDDYESITITGGTVNATGGKYGAGIGGGLEGGGGTVTISDGAKVYAEGGSNAEDIGKGGNGSRNGSLTVSGADTKVFVAHSAQRKEATLNDSIKWTTDTTNISNAKAGIFDTKKPKGAYIWSEIIPLEETVTTIEAGKTYTIANKEQLKRLATLVSGGQDCKGAMFTVIDDISLNDTTDWENWDEHTTGLDPWTPIGNSDTYFRGTFNGDNHSISGIYINAPESKEQGLFGQVKFGTIENVTVTKSYIKADAYVGGIAGNSSSLIKNCSNLGNICGSTAGGIAGRQNSGGIENCYNLGCISGSNAGGISGANDGTTVKNCYNAGCVSGNQNIGGVSGVNQDSTISNCYNVRAVNGNQNVGGVVGQNVGGTASNCYNAGPVSGNQYVGGVAGQNAVYSVKSSVSNCYNAGTVNGEKSVGGVVGQNPGGSVLNCFYDKQICTVGDGNAEGKLTSKLVGESLKDSFGEENWVFAEGLYPRLKNMENTDAAYVSTTPVFLTVDESGEQPVIETVEKVTKNFAVGSGHGVKWSSSDPSTISISDGTATVKKKPDPTTVTLTARLNDALKTVTVNSANIGTESGGGTSGGTSGGSHHHHTRDDGADVIVNGKTETAGKAKSSVVNGKKKQTVNVDSQKIEKILKTKGDGASVIIPVIRDGEIASGVLTGKIVKDLEDKSATLEVMTKTATYTLPAEELNIDSISKQIGENVSLADIEVEISIAEPTDEMVKVVKSSAKNGGFDLMLPAVDFSIHCTHGKKTLSANRFNSYIKRTVAIPDGVDPSKITTAIVVDEDGKTRHVPTKVTVVDGNYYAVINSLTNSTYSVIWHPIEFADVENHWAKEAINDMGSRMIVNGVGESNYVPNRSITRAEVAAIVVRALGLNEGLGEEAFTDINKSDWYCGSIETAVSYGLIKGYCDGTFKPNEKITREQVAAIVARAMKKTGLHIELRDAEVADFLSVYNDATSVSNFAKVSAATCIKANILKGRDNNCLAPKDNISRAEVAVMIQRLLENSELI